MIRFGAIKQIISPQKYSIPNVFETIPLHLISIIFGYLSIVDRICFSMSYDPLLRFHDFLNLDQTKISKINELLPKRQRPFLFLDTTESLRV